MTVQAPGPSAEINRLAGPVILAPELRQPLRWYLRDVPGVAVGELGVAKPAIAIRLAEGDALLRGYAGQRYEIGTSGELSLQGWKEVWRWLAYRETPGARAGVTAVVNVRAAPSR